MLTRHDEVLPGDKSSLFLNIHCMATCYGGRGRLEGTMLLVVAI
jgi:hypothetical protein